MIENIKIAKGDYISHDLLNEELEFENPNLDDEMSEVEESYMDGFYSDELPSEMLKRRSDPFFPNHF